MWLRFVILPLLLGLSMALPARAHAKDGPIERCAEMRFDQNAPELIGYALKKTKLRDVDIGPGPVTVQPRMAGLKGPSITLMGRDVRLAVTTQQSSPQELWHRAQWNIERPKCGKQKLTWRKSIKQGLYWKGIIDTTAGFTTYDPFIMYRTRVVLDGMLVRPQGFVFGGAVSIPIDSNTGSLLYLPETRDPVRRDLTHFANNAGVERLFASWRTTPITDVHLALSAGWLEEMYGGFGAEIIYRPFASPFWAGIDGWQVWRRDPYSFLNTRWTDETTFTGHVRAGYDVPDTPYGVSIAAGKYLGGDVGATVGALRRFESGLRIEASLTWTNYEEQEGFFRNTRFDPVIRASWPIGRNKHRESRVQLRQVGRDGGQMLDRPLPLEHHSEAFSTREIIRHWPQMFK